jgi:hypothetical protein
MYPCAKLKLDQLFLQWLSLPDSQQLVSIAFWRQGGQQCSSALHGCRKGSSCAGLCKLNPHNIISLLARYHAAVVGCLACLAHAAVLPCCAAALQVSNLVEDAKQGKSLKGPSSSSFTTPLSPTTAHAIFASTVGLASFRSSTLQHASA